MDVYKVLDKITQLVIDPVLLLIFSIGLLIFVYGIFEYLWNLSSNSKSKEDGKRHMLWGVVGMFIMFAALGITHVIQNTVEAVLSK